MHNIFTFLNLGSFSLQIINFFNVKVKYLTDIYKSV